jgi:tRNA modification GTPase
VKAPFADNDTLAAMATPPGSGGIAILRISGPAAFRVLERLFLPGSAPPAADAPRSPFLLRPRHMYFGHALDREGRILDQVLAVFMPGPHSATGEDVAEIHCHGGQGIAAALLESCLAAGARLAGPGEFTRRAFLNGRVDLTQAEAVAEIISASSREGIRLAQAKLDGLLGRRIAALRADLDALRQTIILAVDFPEEEGEVFLRPAFAAALERIRADIRVLLASFRRARLWREGARVVLAGRVNAGKSSLFNALLGRRRTIVSDLPGTTRDYIEESVSLEGLPVRLTDTAGLRPDGDGIEVEGMGLSRRLAEEADCLLLVVDACEGIAPDDRDFLAAHRGAASQGRLLLVLNKTDRAGDGQAAARNLLPENCPVFAVSARDGDGLGELIRGIREAVQGRGKGCLEPGPGDLAPNVRQAGLLETVLEELTALGEDLDRQLPPDILGVRLDAAADALDEVTGGSSTEELLDRIFSSFCIGK